MNSARWLEPIAGTVILAVALVDVFLTVLYARAGASIFSHKVASVTWRLFRGISGPLGKSRPHVLSLAGPVILVIHLLTWTMMLTAGATLFIYPQLGRGIVTAASPTPTDLVSAIYAAGTSMSVVHTSTFDPATTMMRLFYVFTSFVGVSVLSLTLTYLLQVYSALSRRNTLGLKIWLRAGCTADAARLVGALGPGGDFDASRSDLSEIAAELAAAKEVHHLYPVLFYFRFDEAYYSVSRFALVSLDAVSLIETVLDRDQYGTFQDSSSVSATAEAALVLVETLEQTFVHQKHDTDEPPDAETAARWCRRYHAAADRFRAAGIAVTPDLQYGAEQYIKHRARWDGHIATLAPSMAYTMEDIDPVGSRA